MKKFIFITYKLKGWLFKFVGHYKYKGQRRDGILTQCRAITATNNQENQ